MYRLPCIGRHARFCIISSAGFLVACLTFYFIMLTIGYTGIVSVRTVIGPSPTIARVLYLFVCENQAEVDAYSESFPSISADVMFYCWKMNCVSDKFRSLDELYVSTWSGQGIRNRTLVRTSAPGLFYYNSLFYRVRPRVFIVNELKLNLTKRTSVSWSRNKLFEQAFVEERKQGWRWSYLNIADGDVHTTCPLAEKLLTNQSAINNRGFDELVFADLFRSFVSLSSLTGEAQCFLLIDAFILSVSPAMAAIFVDTEIPPTIHYPGLVAQVAYHVDAMLNAIHRDAFPFLLPYCIRYDASNWWIGAGIVIYRTLCLYGHVILFNSVIVNRQIHRPYPRNGSAFAIDDGLNLVPEHLLPLQKYMKLNRAVSPLVLHNYGGWNPMLTSEVCRRHHTAINIDTCLVSGERSYINT